MTSTEVNFEKRGRLNDHQTCQVCGACRCDKHTHKSILTILLLPFAFFLFTSFVHSQEYSFQEIFYPGAYETRVEAINDQGEVAGTYQLPHVVPTPGGGTRIQGGPTKGFKWKNGIFTEFTFPDAVTTFPAALNNKGDSVGTYDKDGLTQSFFYTAKRPKDTWQVLEIGANAWATSLNERRQIIGQLAGQGKGFLYEDGELSDLEPLISCPLVNSLGIGPTGINERGDIIGWYSCSGSYGGFFSDNLGDSFALFDLPGTLGVTVPLAINRKGVIAGMYFDTLLGWRPWVLANQVFSKPVILNVRDYADIRGISDKGEIAGTYTSISDGRNHGYIAIPLAPVKLAKGSK